MALQGIVVYIHTSSWLENFQTLVTTGMPDILLLLFTRGGVAAEALRSEFKWVYLLTTNGDVNCFEKMCIICHDEEQKTVLSKHYSRQRVRVIGARTLVL